MRVSVCSLLQRLTVSFSALMLMAGASVSAQNVPSLVPSTLRVVAGGATSNPVYPGTCPTAGYTLLDQYGDGCLATDILLGTVTTSSGAPTAGTGPRYAVMDSAGNIFFSDYQNGLVRRIDANTGVVNAVAGGAATSPGLSSVCGGLVSIDAIGDGCLSTAVHLSHPEGLAFASNGDLYFADSGQYDVRRIAATNGLIPATGGVITNIAGYAAGSPTYGYVVSNSTTTVVAATQSYLDAPYGIAFDGNGDLFITEEYKTAVLVVNTNATGSNTVNGVTVPAGTIWKVAGAYGTTAPPASTCPNGSGTATYGCSYNSYVEGAQANSTWLDRPYGVALDTTGNLYIANEFLNVTSVVSPSGVLTTFAGQEGSYAQDITKRAAAGSFAVGSNFGIALEQSTGVFYQSDALNGVIWRVDPDTKSMYVVAGGATSVCSTASDTYGDGCPAKQGTFGSSISSSTGGAKYASTGVFGLSVDRYSDVLVGDGNTGRVRVVATGANFGTIASPKTNTLTIHFAANDGPASSSPYVITSGASNFSVGIGAACTQNTSDNSQDCPVPITATPTVEGLTAGVLTVTSAAGKTSTFPLSLFSSPTTTTKLTLASTCSSGTTFANTDALTFTATVTANGDLTGSVQFYDQGNPIGDPVALTVNGSTGTATLTHTFSSGSHSLTAKYSGDTVFTSSSSSAFTFTTTAASFSIGPVNTDQQNTVTAGQTALYSFPVTTSIYTGSLSFFCSGLPAGASCSFSPAVLSVTSCDTTFTVALSINTSANPVTLSKQNLIAGFGSGRLWTMLGASLLALLVGLRRRTLGKGFGIAAMMAVTLVAASSLTACSSQISDKSIPTKSGTYTVTITAAGSPSAATASSQSTTVTLTVK